MLFDGDKIILSLCDYSGNWSKFYREAGYDVRCFDLKNGDDVRTMKFVKGNVYGILAAPVCTMFAVSGNRTRAIEKQNGDYEEKIAVALDLVNACLAKVALYKPRFWALENPVGTLGTWLGKPRFYFNPSDFGDPYTKKTCLWGEFNLPVKNPVQPLEGSKMWAKYGGKSEKTKEMRSMTPLGFARAFFEANR